MILMTISQMRKLRVREVKRLIMVSSEDEEEDLDWEPLTPCFSPKKAWLLQREPDKIPTLTVLCFTAKDDMPRPVSNVSILLA